MFAWSFSSRKEHGVTWYLVGIIVVLSLVLYGITQELYLMSIVSFLFAGVYILMENNSQPVVSVSIDESGIHVGNSSYEFGELQSFSIIKIADTPTYLRIVPKKKLQPVLDILLTPEVNHQELRSCLRWYLTEDENASLSSADALIHVMRL